MPTEHLGWIGLGKMGLPMSRRANAAGYAVSAFARSPAARAKAEAAGFAAADTISALAAQTDVIFSTVPDDAALCDIVFGESGLAGAMRPGQIFVEMSTVSPGCSAEVAAALDPLGIPYLRAPVSGSTAAAGTGSLTVIVSGPEHAHQQVCHLLESFAKSQFHVGPADEARYLKLVINALVGATSALLAEALTLGRKGGLGTPEMLDVICESAVASPLIRYKRNLLATDNYTAQFSVRQMMKDLDLILAAGRQEHVPMHLVSIVRQNFEAAFASGRADEDFFVLYQEQMRLAGM